MNCPKCHGKTKVRKTFNVVRLRICTVCKFRFFTVQELSRANWTEDETFFAISFAYVFMCKVSGESDDKLTERISKIAAAMKVEPPTEQ